MPNLLSVDKCIASVPNSRGNLEQVVFSSSQLVVRYPYLLLCSVEEDSSWESRWRRDKDDCFQEGTVLTSKIGKILEFIFGRAAWDLSALLIKTRSLEKAIREWWSRWKLSTSHLSHVRTWDWRNKSIIFFWGTSLEAQEDLQSLS